MNSIKINRSSGLALQITLLLLVSVSPVVPQSIKIVITGAMIIFNAFYEKPLIDNSFLVLEILLIFSAVLDIRNTVSGQPYSLVNIMYPVYFACGYLVAQRYEHKEFLLSYERILLVFAVLSLIGMSVYYINPLMIYTFPTYVQNGVTHHTIFFFNYLFPEGWMLVRNSGVAWEPGLFQILLNIALQVAIKYYDGKKRLVRAAIYFLAIILTRSTMGYAVMFINIFSLLKEKKVYFFFFAISALALSASISQEIVYQIENKLVGSASFAFRYDPLINAIKVSWYKLFGLGSTAYDEMLQHQNIGSFDAYTQILMRYGYPVLMMIVSRLCYLWKEERGIALIIAAGLFSEPVWGCSLIAAFLFLKEPERQLI